MSEGLRDTKDWTWVLERPCEQCGFDAAAVARHQIGARLRAGMPAWHRLLSGPTASVRPDPTTWSPLEYACHVRDVHIVFSARVAMVLGQHDPEFANWDQDETAESQGYAEQDPATVAREPAAAMGRCSPWTRWRVTTSTTSSTTCGTSVPARADSAPGVAPCPSAPPGMMAACGTRSSGTGWTTRSATPRRGPGRA